MAVLSHLEPAKAFHFFEEICSIPHGSGNIRQISDYCADFARQRDLKYIQDELGNVIIFAPATAGYEGADPIILQGHMDMVCVKTPDCPLDLTRDGLKLAVDGDFIYAEGTSLGADNGIAVAMMLALLDSPELPHPPVEALITVDEETGLFGAAFVDFAPLKGYRLINMDSEEEGVFTVSCAGGVRASCSVNVRREQCDLPQLKVSVEGLLGGHSGVEIHKGRGNALKLLGRVLKAIADKTEIRLVSYGGGAADNVIAREGAAVICAADVAAVAAAAAEMEQQFKSELGECDPGVRVCVSEGEQGSVDALTAADTSVVIEILNEVPQGVQAMSASIEGLVQTSLNLGVAVLDDALTLRFALRSSVTSEKADMLKELTEIFERRGGNVSTDGDYPAWEYRQDSPLRDLMAAAYTDMYGKPPVIEAIHAGLECGQLTGKRPELDCVSIGPNLQDVHSVDEKLSVASTKRTWEFLLEVLKRSK